MARRSVALVTARSVPLARGYLPATAASRLARLVRWAAMDAAPPDRLPAPLWRCWALVRQVQQLGRGQAGRRLLARPVAQQRPAGLPCRRALPVCLPSALLAADRMACPSRSAPSPG